MTLDRDELVAEVVQACGLSDFGSGSYVEGLDALLASIERDAKLSPAALDRVQQSVQRRLRNRLEVEAWYREHPGHDTAPIEGPVSINGLPRTGTTALANMMSVDETFRPLRGWEQSQPCPPPTLANEHDDPRRVALARSHEELRRTRPDLAAMHLYDVDTTVEDVGLLGIDCRSQELSLPVFGYHAWWRDCAMEDAYAYHRRVALLLQSHRPPNRWLFKAPYHCFHLEAFLSAYPDAKFVMTHRDPAKVIPSVVSFVTALYPPGALETHDPVTLGQHFSEHLRIGLERALEARARIGEDRFVDVHHREFVSDPFGTIERVYKELGYELRDDVRSAMERWHAANRSGAHGVHRYSPEQFGLRADQLRSDYAFYIDRFDIAIGDRT